MHGDGAVLTTGGQQPRPRPVLSAGLILLAVGAVAAGLGAWTANALLRDEVRFAHVLSGALVREPVRSEAAPDLAADLADLAGDALATGPGAGPSAATRRDLEAVATRVVAGPAFDAQLEPLIRALSAWAVSGREDASDATNVLWDTYVGEVERTHPTVGMQLRAALPAREDIERAIAADAATSLPAPVARTAGLRRTLRWLPIATGICFILGVGAAVAAAVLSRGSGRLVAAAAVLPALVVLVAWALSRGPGSWAFITHEVAAAALPACGGAVAAGFAALVVASRRLDVLSPPPAPGPRRARPW